MPISNEHESTVTVPDEKQGLSEAQVAAVVEAAYILEALRK
jgi:hypothetical protein